VEYQDPTPQTELQSLQQDAPQQTAPPSQEVVQAKTEAFLQHLEASQNLMLGIVGGLLAAIVGGAIWAGVTVATEYQIGWMAVGVGFLVGLAVRVFGKGLSPAFGVVGALCALLGCLLGNVLSACGFVSLDRSVPFFEVVFEVIKRPDVVVGVLTETFSPMDILFYGLAVYEGYKFSFRQITEEELNALQQN
jgi:hypothetical protein